MLANTSKSQRPRPPAQVRRSVSMNTTAKNSPPPPYASGFVFPQKPSPNVLLGSPVSTIAQMIGWNGSGAAQSSQSPGTRGEILDWLNERSRDELSDLLLKAEGVIKQRELELDHTSSLCKALYDDNASLQSKHKVLLTRIPPTPSTVSTPSRVDSPLPSPERSSSSYSSHSAFSRAPPSPSDPFQYSIPLPPSGGRRRHIRKISVTPADISLLADQNAELLLKLEKLEAETESTDLAGRRMLKRLEREIGVLREELESVRVKEGEEKDMLTVRKSRPLRSVSGPLQSRPRDKHEDDLFSEEVRDFAPGGSLSSSTSAPGLHPRNLGIGYPESSAFCDPEDGLENRTDPSNQITQHTLMSHLLTKINELEETNMRILAQQAETSEKLRVVQRETEGLGRVYDGLEGLGLGSDLEVEIVDMSEGGENKAESNPPNEEGSNEHEWNNDTIRFRSFRRSLMESLPPPPLDGRGHAGAGTAIEGSLKTNKSLASTYTSSISGHKSRKSVMGLFDGSSASSFPSHSPSPAAHPREQSAALHRNSWSFDSSRSFAESAGSGVVSPTLSSLNLGLSPLGSPSPYRHHGTLSSELGDSLETEFDPSYHLRTSSLYDLSLGMGESAPASRSPSRSPSPSYKCLPIREGDSGEWREDASSTSQGWAPVKSPVVLQLKVEPPTPVKFPEMESPNNGDNGASGETPMSKHSLRYRKMSQTVRSRTANWVDGRFKDTLLGGSGGSTETLRERSPPLPSFNERKGKAKDSPRSVSGSSTDNTPTPSGLGPLKLVSSAINLVEKFTAQAISASQGGMSPAPTSPASARLMPDEGDRGEVKNANVSGLDSHGQVQTPATEAGSTTQVVQVYFEPSDAMTKQDSEGGTTKFGAFVLEVWLWLQFAVIILVFLWAMAKRGPKSVLGEAVAAEQRKLGRA